MLRPDGADDALYRRRRRSRELEAAGGNAGGRRRRERGDGHVGLFAQLERARRRGRRRQRLLRRELVQLGDLALPRGDLGHQLADLALDAAVALIDGGHVAGRHRVERLRPREGT